MPTLPNYPRLSSLDPTLIISDPGMQQVVRLSRQAVSRAFDLKMRIGEAVSDAGLFCLFHMLSVPTYLSRARKFTDQIKEEVQSSVAENFSKLQAVLK